MSTFTTAKEVEAFKPRAKRYDATDGKASGLVLRIEPDGDRVWILRYRNPSTRARRKMKLGEYSRMSLADARRLASKELRKVDHGVDPLEERQAAKEAAERAKADSVAALCKAYIDRHAKPHKRTWRDDQSKLVREILPKWKDRPVTSITRRDCRQLLQAVADRPAPIYANRIAALLSRLFRFAVDEEIIPANPAARLPKLGAEIAARPEGEREDKAYSADEVRAIWQASETLAPVDRTMLRLGLVTGQRPMEIARMEWRELAAEWWAIPGRRTKNGREHRVFLTPLALELVADVTKDHDVYVFPPAMRSKRHLAKVNRTAFAEVRRREKPRHALRDTVATGLAAAGVDVEDIAKVLNHTYGPPVTAGYNAYSYDREKRLALTKWARRLQGILSEAPADPSRVVSIQRGA
jgi:integrase